MPQVHYIPNVSGGKGGKLNGSVCLLTRILICCGLFLSAANEQ